MRLVIDISTARSPDHRKVIKVRTKYMVSNDDSVRIQNYGNTILSAIKEGFAEGFDGIVEHLGEVK